MAPYTQEYLYILTDHQQGTKNKYLSILKMLWIFLFDEMPINTITSQMLLSADSINKGHVNGIQQDTTKTNKTRFVDLNDFAFEAFQQLRLLTYLKYEHVFICDETGEEFTTQKSLSEKFVAALKANGIRYRPAYNTYHTYATVCLMNGLNPVYVTSQLGHSVVMLMKRYAKWINSDKNKEEIAKISNSAKIVPKEKGIKLCI